MELSSDQRERLAKAALEFNSLRKKLQSGKVALSLTTKAMLRAAAKWLHEAMSDAGIRALHFKKHTFIRTARGGVVTITDQDVVDIGGE